MKLLSIFSTILCLTKFEITRAILCVDDKDYIFDNDETKSCKDWVAKIPQSRCPLGDGEVAEACKFTCNKCLCVDDPGSFSGKTCDNWVAQNLQRCNRTLKINGDVSKVRDHCRVLCGADCTPFYQINKNEKIFALKFDDSGEVVSNRMKDARFGTSTVIVGDVMAIGASKADLQEGTVHLYQKNTLTESWDLETRLKASDGNGGYFEGDYFGCSVAMYGNILVVGSYGDDSGYENDDKNWYGYGAGSVYVFERIGGVWMEMQNLFASDGEERGDDYYGPYIQNQFGKSVGITENFIVVQSEKGLYFFKRDSTGIWMEVEKVEGDFGRGLSVFNNIVVTTDLGSVFIYSFNNSVKLEQTLDEYLAPTVSIFGNTLAIGTHEIGVDKLIGYVDIYTRDGGIWEKVQKLVANDDEAIDSPSWQCGHFGYSVAIAEDYLVVGNHGDNTRGINGGAAYFFSREDSGSWVAFKKVIAQDRRGGDFFGQNVSVAGTTAVIGAPNNDDRRGSAYVVELDC